MPAKQVAFPPLIAYIVPGGQNGFPCARQTTSQPGAAAVEPAPFTGSVTRPVCAVNALRPCEEVN